MPLTNTAIAILFPALISAGPIEGRCFDLEAYGLFQFPALISAGPIEG